MIQRQMNILSRRKRDVLHYVCVFTCTDLHAWHAFMHPCVTATWKCIHTMVHIYTSQTCHLVATTQP